MDFSVGFFSSDRSLDSEFTPPMQSMELPQSTVLGLIIALTSLVAHLLGTVPHCLVSISEIVFCILIFGYFRRKSPNAILPPCSKMHLLAMFIKQRKISYFILSTYKIKSTISWLDQISTIKSGTLQLPFQTIYEHINSLLYQISFQSFIVFSV